MSKETESDKIVKKWGTSLVLILSKEDKDILNLSAGDVVKIKIWKKKVK